MDDEIEESKAQEIVSTASAKLKSIGIAKIAVLVLIIIAAGWYFSQPQPGNLTITVNTIDDSTPVQDAIVSLTAANGEVINGFTAITASDGVVSFARVPAGQMTIEVSAPGFEVERMPATLTSGSSDNVEVKVARDVSLTLSPASIRGTATETCVKETQVMVSNEGGDAVETSFIGSGELANAVSSNTVTVSPGDSQNVTLTIDVSRSGVNRGDTLSGDARVRGTKKKVSINLRIAEALRVDVQPSSIICPADRQCQQIVTVTNRGTSSLENLKIEPTPDLARVLEDGEVQRFYSSTSVAPGSEAKFAVRIDSTRGQAIGVISVKADCFEKQVDVRAG